MKENDSLQGRKPPLTLEKVIGIWNNNLYADRLDEWVEKFYEFIAEP